MRHVGGFYTKIAALVTDERYAILEVEVGFDKWNLCFASGGPVYVIVTTSRMHSRLVQTQLFNSHCPELHLVR